MLTRHVARTGFKFQGRGLGGADHRYYRARRGRRGPWNVPKTGPRCQAPRGLGNRDGSGSGSRACRTPCSAVGVALGRDRGFGLIAHSLHVRAHQGRKNKGRAAPPTFGRFRVQWSSRFTPKVNVVACAVPFAYAPSLQPTLLPLSPVGSDTR